MLYLTLPPNSYLLDNFEACGPLTTPENIKNNNKIHLRKRKPLSHVPSGDLQDSYLT